ncbi:hypothetical protein [Salmonella phage PhiSEP1]|nr:hypothetical protein [Salmonella phage PhiSEP1]
MAQSQPWRNSLTLLNLRYGTPGEARHTKPKVFIVHNKKISESWFILRRLAFIRQF